MSVDPELVAVISEIASLPTEIGREIHKLSMFAGKAWPMYNDFNANTGPNKLFPVDLGAGTVGDSAFTFQTEETWTARVLDGKFYVPGMDLRGASTDALAVATDEITWTVLSSITPTPEHVFDVAKTSGGLFVCGAAGGSTAYIWQSVDEGDTWSISLTVGGTGYARFYSMVQLGDDLLAKFYDDGSNISLFYRWTGSGWSLAPNPFQVTDSFGPFTYQGVTFAIGQAFDKNTGNIVANPPQLIIRAEDASFADAISASLPSNRVYDGCAVDGVFYLLTDTQDILVGNDDGVWSALITLTDNTIRSLAVDTNSGYFGFGTTEGTVLRAPIPG